MPNLKNAEKALRQSVKRAARNTSIQENIEFMRRSFRKLLESQKIDEAQKLMHDLGKALDKAAGKKVLKANTVSRIKSRAMKNLNKLKK